jgi:hypothetical protein
MKGNVVRFFMNLRSNGGWKNPRANTWSKTLINQIFIHEQLGVSKEGTFDEAKTALKRIIGPHAFVENEQWSVVRMKEESHAKVVAILQFFYQKN